MIAGKLDRRVTLRRASSTQSGFNTPVPVWADLATVWASKTDLSDAERVRAGQESAIMITRFQVRYALRISDLDPRDQLICEGRKYQIVAVKQIGRRVGLEITAKALAETP